jgi:hypothetical protein
MLHSTGRCPKMGNICAWGVATVVTVLLLSCTYHADQHRTDTGQGGVGTGATDTMAAFDAASGEPTKLDGPSGDLGGLDWAGQLVLNHPPDVSTSAEMPSDTRGTEIITDDAVFRDAVGGAVVDLATESIVRDGPPALGLDTGSLMDLRSDNALKDTIANDADGPFADTPPPDAPAADAPALGPGIPPSQPPCAGSSQLCSDGECHDLLTDNSHCGACEHSCLDGLICSNGSCACTTGTSLCGTRCTNTTFDPQNCGVCGQSCDGGLLCSGGTCAGVCINSKLCGDHCADLNNDRANCGACNQACPAGYACDGTGHCSLVCQPLETPCNGQCVDLDDDVSNCGSCGNACTFANAQAYCTGDTCQMGACLPGYGNPDGSHANGCECAMTNGGIEVCDGIDNNCDGLIDFTIVNGLPTATCKCQEQIPTVTTATPQCGSQPCSNPQCQISSAGQEMEFDYALGACTGPNYPWAQCSFDTVYMNAFDADHGDTGILEIYLCVDGLSAGETMNGIGVYYGPYPGRKRFAFFGNQELSQGVSNGCYTKHFRPSDAGCQPESGLPSTCMSGCPNGKWGSSGHPECVVDYDGVPLWVTAENCQGTAAVSANIQHVQVRYLTGAVCTCQTDTDCRDPNRPHCDQSSGVCVPL